MNFDGFRLPFDDGFHDADFNGHEPEFNSEPTPNPIWSVALVRNAGRGMKSSIHRNFAAADPIDAAEEAEAELPGFVAVGTTQVGWE